MNTEILSPHPRFVCQVARQWHALTDRELRHVAGCVDCQAFFRASHALETELRRQTAADLPAISPMLERRILQAVRMAADDAASGREVSRSREPRRWWPGAIAGSALVAALLLMAWPGGIGLRSDNRTNGSMPRDDAAVVMTAVQTLSTQLVENVLPATGELVANNPLQQEADSVYSDARSALGFLAMNFLPSRREMPRPRSG